MTSSRMLPTAVLISIIFACVSYFMSAAPVAKPVPNAFIPVVYDACFIGALDGKMWLDADTAATKLKGGETYRLYTLERTLGAGRGTKPEKGPAGFTVNITPMPTAADNVVAVGAVHDAMPRRVEQLGANADVYVRVARDILRAKGMPKAPVRIKRIVRVDLEGDGRDEVLFSATTPDKDYLFSHGRKGGYSFAAMRKVVGGAVKTSIIAGQFHTKANPDLEGAPPEEFTIVGALDVDGDGVMEIVVGSRYYEGYGIMIMRAGNNDISEVFSGGCGV
jgi:hypothetical protein